MKFYCESEQEVLKAVQASEAGLSQEEAQKRLEAN